MLIRLNQIMRGWANYFKHAVAKHTFSKLDDFVWWRVIRLLRARHRWSWKDVRRRLTTPTGRWLPISGGRDRTVQHRRGPGHPVPLPRQQDPQPLDPCNHA